MTAALPAQDLGRAKAFYVEKVGLQALKDSEGNLVGVVPA
jgi:predicted enzyme related to lactoylglutathione lyase